MPATEIIVFAPLIVLLAYITFGMAGFGTTLVSIPLLAHLLPLQVVLPMVALLDCVGSLSMSLRLRANMHKRELLPLLPFLLAGMVIGVFLLLRLPGTVLIASLGLFALFYGTLYALNRGTQFRIARWATAPIGLTAGACSSLFGVGGPIYVMYLVGRGATPDQIRATVPVIFIFTSTGRVMLYAAAGLYSWQILGYAATLLPVMFFGLYLGHRLHLNLSRDTLIRVIGGLLMVSGVSLLLRALEA